MRARAWRKQRIIRKKNSQYGGCFLCRIPRFARAVRLAFALRLTGDSPTTGAVKCVYLYTGCKWISARRKLCTASDRLLRPIPGVRLRATKPSVVAFPPVLPTADILGNLK